MNNASKGRCVTITPSGNKTGSADSVRNTRLRKPNMWDYFTLFGKGLTLKPRLKSALTGKPAMKTYTVSFRKTKSEG